MFIGVGIGTNLISQIVSDTAGYSCSDISAIAQEAVFGPLRSLGGMYDIQDANSQDVRLIDLSAFKDAISKTKKSVTGGLLAKCDALEMEQMAGGHWILHASRKAACEFSTYLFSTRVLH